MYEAEESYVISFPWKKNLVKVTKIEIGDGITSISKEAFKELGALTDVTIGEKVETIGSYAFSKCSQLKSIDLKNTVSVGNGAFEWCSSLESFRTSGALKTIGSYAFHGCSKLTEISLGHGGTDVCEYAFSECISLEKVWANGDRSSSLADHAFIKCEKLKTVSSRVPIKVAENTFKGCNEDLVLTWFEWETQTTPYYKLSYAFKDSTLTLVYEEGYVGERDYKTTGDIQNKPSWHKDDFKVKIEKVVISDGMKRIGEEAFKDRSDVTDISIPNSVKKIGREAFSNCKGLTEINLPNALTLIDTGAFAGCGLKKLVVPSSVTHLGNFAFASNPIQTVEFRGKGCHITDETFGDCTSLEKVMMHNGPNYVSYYAFQNSGVNGGRFTIEWKDHGLYAVYANPIKKLFIQAPDDNQTYELTDLNRAVNPTINISPWDMDYFNLPIWEVDIGERITNIGSQRFYGRYDVTTVTMADSVKNIGASAFAGCSSLKTIKISKTVDSVATQAFKNCLALSEFEVYNPATEFQPNVFEGCDTGINTGKLTIYGYRGSTANEYANNNDITFVPFDGIFCRVEFYYDGTINNLLTQRYVWIEKDEKFPLTDDSNIIKWAREIGDDARYTYERFEENLLDDNQNNVIRLYYTSNTSTIPSTEIAYTVNFYDVNTLVKIQDISGGTVKIKEDEDVLESKSYTTYRDNKFGDKYVLDKQWYDSITKTISVKCHEKTPEDEIAISWKIVVYGLREGKKSELASIPDAVTEKPSEINKSLVFNEKKQKLVDDYEKENYFLENGGIEYKPQEAVIEMHFIYRNGSEPNPWEPEEFVVDFYNLDTNEKIDEISGEKVIGIYQTIEIDEPFCILVDKQVGDKYSPINVEKEPGSHVIKVWCTNRLPPELIDYTVKVYLNSWDNQVMSVPEKVTETRSKVLISDSFRRVMKQYVYEVYTKYTASKIEKYDDEAEIRVLLTQIPTTYTIKYYYHYDEKTKKTETCSGIVGDVITKDTIQQKINTHKKEGYILANTFTPNPAPLTLIENANKNIIRVYYVKEPVDPTQTGFRIEYYYDYTDKEEEVYSGEIGQIITKNTIQQQINAHKKEGYILVKDPETITLGKNPDANIIRVYYVNEIPTVPDLTGFRIEYYYDYEIDNNATEIFPGTIGETVTAHSIRERIRVHQREGYMLSNEDDPNPEPDAIKLEADPDANIMRVYYVKESKTEPGQPENPKQAGYKIEYYYDGKLNHSATGVFSGEEGNTITKEMIQTHIDAHKNGYQFSKTENLPLTLKSNIANNVIKVYYTKDGSTNIPTTYTIKYYYDYNENTKETETGSGMVGDVITKDTIQQKINSHKKEGYILANSFTPNPAPLTLIENANKNIIRVYYVKDPPNPTQTGFRIEYYYDYTDKEEEVYSGEIGQIITKNTIQQQINAHKKEGYILVKDPETITLGKNPDANIMRVYYVKEPVDPTQTGFRIEYYYDYEIDNNATEVFPGTIGETVTANTIRERIRVHQREGYILDNRFMPNPAPITLMKDADENTIIVYYVKGKRPDPTPEDPDPKPVPEDPDLTGFRIEYYYDYKDKRTEVLPGKIGETVTANTIQKQIEANKGEGYILSREDNPNPDPDSIKLEVNPNTNIMRVYYVKESKTEPGQPDNPKQAGYKIEYYYDGKLNHSATGVFSGQEGDTITKEMIQSYIDAHKNGYQFSKTENLPLSLKSNIANNIIKVYYTKDGSTNPDPGGKDPNPGGTDPDPGGENPNPGGNTPGSNNPGGNNPGGNTPGGNNSGGNNSGGSSNGNGNGLNGGTASSGGASSKGNGQSITGSPSDSLASKIIPKTGLEVGLLVGIIALSGVAVVCYKKSKWD